MDISLYDLRHRKVLSLDRDLLGCGQIAKIANASYRSPKQLDYREILDNEEDDNANGAEEQEDGEDSEIEDRQFERKLEIYKRQPMSPVSMDDSLMATQELRLNQELL